MSNYPPGVTGNERAIAGYDETVMHRECHSHKGKLQIMPQTEWSALMTTLERAKVVKEKELDRAAGGEISDKQLEMSYQGIVGNLVSLAEWLSSYDPKTLVEYTDDCPFKGEIDVQYGDGMIYWECPICGTEHEEEFDPRD